MPRRLPRSGAAWTRCWQPRKRPQLPPVADDAGAAADSLPQEGRMSPERAAFRATAVAAARGAGQIQRQHARTRIAVEKKGLADITTAVDRECEDFIVALIRSHHPEHGVLGEEGAQTHSSSEYLWIIDPLDGTKNYAH